MLLGGSRARAGAPLDQLSDFDVIVVVRDLTPFKRGEAWVRSYGAPLVVFRENTAAGGIETLTRLVLYEDGTKVDYTVWPVELLRRTVEAPQLPDRLDIGYRVLVDKDGLTRRLKPATDTAHLPRPPTRGEYRALVEEFWWETTYVAKNLWRDELLPAKYSFESVIKLELLRRMLEWYLETQHDWSVRPGPHGRGLKRLLPREIWERVETTFVGADVRENWRALFAVAELFRQVAITVAEKLDYEYPHDLDRGVVSYLSRIRERPR